MITLQETPDSYLLTIPAYQRDRAKDIEGRRWDAIRRCWVYPRRRETYEALIAEFGDELRGGVPPPPDQAAVLPTLDADALAARIYEQLRELGHIKEEDPELEATISGLEETLKSVSAERDQLRSDNEALRRTIDETRDAPSAINIFELAGEVASSTADDPKLRELASHLRNTPTLAVDLGKRVEIRLRQLTRSEAAVSFYDLLNLARDQNILSREAWGLAQTLRTLRNVVAHLETEQPTQTARSLICLLTSALVLRELKR